MTQIEFLFDTTCSHLILIFILFFVTYARILGKDFFFVIDDDGVFRYTDRWQGESKDKDGKIIPEKKIDSYECCSDKPTKHEVKNLAYNPHLGQPGAILRFIRVNLGRRYKVIGTNKKGHQVWGYIQDPIRHHILSMVVQYINLVLGYFFLKPLIGENLAFASCLLFSVHPLTTQVVGWISGLMYSLSMVFALLTLNTSLYFHSYYLIIPLTVLFSFISGLTLYFGCFTFLVLLFLKFWWAAFASAIIGLSVLFVKGKETRDFRIKHFKEQNMAHTTTLNWRKPIVMVKTLFYYVPIVLLPIKMGLYHIWGYFYEDPIERIDKMFFAGLFIIGLILSGFVYAPFSIKLGITWFLSYWFIFSNFMTAQQFVADRYVAVPAFGICIILVTFLYPTPLFWIVIGLYAMRTFCHLSTFKNEVDYYLSNFQNFRKSEVALGNLGVAYMNQGMPGSGVDAWLLATKINPHYDVSWYNLYSIFRANGRLQEALTFFKKVMDSKIIHFEDRWRKELEEFDKQVNNLQPDNTGKDLIQQANNEWRKYG